MFFLIFSCQLIPDQEHTFTRPLGRAVKLWKQVLPSWEMSLGEVSYLMPKKGDNVQVITSSILKGPHYYICKKDGKGPALGDLILSKTERISISTNSDTIDYSTKAEYSVQIWVGKGFREQVQLQLCQSRESRSLYKDSADKPSGYQSKGL